VTSGRSEPAGDRELLGAFRDLAAGRGVRRGRHSMVHDGFDRSRLFVEALRAEGFEERQVSEVPVDPNQRVPAFLVREGRADFGWVFWEKFDPRRKRKLFGSVVRNAKGDWEIQLGSGSRDRVFVRLEGVIQADPDRPSSLG
jgi:hypothetical protein